MPLSLTDSFDIGHPRTEVWQHLQEVDLVASCFPGAALDAPDGELGHRGSIRLKLGPTTVTFRGILQVRFDSETFTATLDAKGDDSRRTRASAHATVVLVDIGAGQTRLTIDAQVEVVGALSQFAQAGGVEVTRVLLGDFGRNFETRLDHAGVGSPSPDPALPDNPRPVSSQSAVSVVSVFRRAARRWLAARLGRVRQRLARGTAR